LLGVFLAPGFFGDIAIKAQRLLGHDGLVEMLKHPFASATAYCRTVQLRH
jgi:hypothetical protein